MTAEGNSFKCFNCSKMRDQSERIQWPALVKILFVLGWLLFARSFRSPSDLCESCSAQGMLFVVLGMIFGIALLVGTFTHFF
jgi:hypothetical protein